MPGLSLLSLHLVMKHALSSLPCFVVQVTHYNTKCLLVFRMPPLASCPSCLPSSDAAPGIPFCPLLSLHPDCSHPTCVTSMHSSLLSTEHLNCMSPGSCNPTCPKLNPHLSLASPFLLLFPSLGVVPQPPTRRAGDWSHLPLAALLPLPRPSPSACWFHLFTSSRVSLSLQPCALGLVTTSLPVENSWTPAFILPCPVASTEEGESQQIPDPTEKI